MLKSNDDIVNDFSFDSNEKEEPDNEIQDDSGPKIPFDTRSIKVTMQPMALSSIIARLKNDEIDLQPSFQRNGDLWKTKQMSRLIESLLLKMPLPIFYFDVANPDKWLVVDGLQRLSTIKKFAVDKKLTLKGLEFLTDLNGKNFDQLERSLLRVIEESPIATYQIEPQTPKEVRYSIFNRINTGGLQLNAQEIRQALNQKGCAVKFLEQQTTTDIFKKIVAIKSERMLDRELVLRFCAFKILPVDEKFGNLSTFLDRAIEALDQYNDIEDPYLKKLSSQFQEVLTYSDKILGNNHRFSRNIGKPDNTKSLNRSLFDVLTVVLSQVVDQESLLDQKEVFKNDLAQMINDEQTIFSKAIYQGTNSKKAVEDRFNEMRKLVKKYTSLNGNT